MVFTPSRFAAKWPFWLLVLAWICANSPQSATYHAIEWMTQARTFNHQERLAAEIKQTLDPQRHLAHSHYASWAAKEKSVPSTPKPVTSVDAALKKIELSQPAEEPGIPVLCAQIFVYPSEVTKTWRSISRDVPYQPPRAGRHA